MAASRSLCRLAVPTLFRIFRNPHISAVCCYSQSLTWCALYRYARCSRMQYNPGSWGACGARRPTKHCLYRSIFVRNRDPVNFRPKYESLEMHAKYSIVHISTGLHTESTPRHIHCCAISNNELERTGRKWYARTQPNSDDGGGGGAKIIIIIV